MKYLIYKTNAIWSVYYYGVSMPKKHSKSSRKNITKLSAEEARNFFLKEENYFSLDLPPYFVFTKILEDTYNILKNKKFPSLIKKPRKYENINYTILSNKDGKYSWRPFQLINPVFYVAIVMSITDENNWAFLGEKFSEFSKNKKIKCMSIPVMSLSSEADKAEQVTHWWQKVEQISIALSLEYEYFFETDITDCYGSIYTHSIAWALHTKKDAKKERTNKTLLGNIIDNYIQDMCFGQTNGIPQGSVLMDFIAEIVLGYADLELSERIKNESISDYYILRYRDDYRIFVNNPQDGEKIIKLLTEVMIELGLKLNPLKTKLSNSVVRSSIKSDKLAWIGREKWATSFQKQLLIIHEHAISFPNSGSLLLPLLQYYKKLAKEKKPLTDQSVIISIIVDIAYRNPRTYAISAAILSKLISLMENDAKLDVIQKIQAKFSKIPNTGYMEIWLQRVSLPFTDEIKYQEILCKIASGEEKEIWNNAWIKSTELEQAVNSKKIIDVDKLNNIEPIIPHDEIELFADYKP